MVIPGRWRAPARRWREAAGTAASTTGSAHRCILSHRPTHEIASRRNRCMTYVITEPCIGVKDASCVDVCPVDCIHATDDDAMYFIDPDECIDCGACEPECPVTAIFAEDAVPDDQQKYIQINADYFANK
jgi:NAD-dependent dihydropyrimidine dehydrogenase PreA subunit